MQEERKREKGARQKQRALGNLAQHSLCDACASALKGDLTSFKKNSGVEIYPIHLTNSFMISISNDVIKKKNSRVLRQDVSHEFRDSVTYSWSPLYSFSMFELAYRPYL